MEIPVSPRHIHAESHRGAPVMVRFIAGVIILSSTLAPDFAYAGTCPQGLQLQQEMRGLQQQRENIKRQMRMVMGTPGAASRFEGQLNVNRVLIENLFTLQALDRFEISDDPRMLGQILSQQNRQDIQIGRASADTWYMRVNGKLLPERWSKLRILQQQRRALCK